MAVNREKFFDRVRNAPFSGLVLRQREGMEAVLNEWDRRGLSDLRMLAYMLATDFHETAQTMQAIAEYGKGKGHSYGQVKSETGKAYYGRGLVQLTWDYNYKKMGDRLGHDLYRNPDLALSLPIAVQIMFEGMIHGSFTGKKLGHYFTTTKTDWVNARRIINGTDRAELIAGYAKKFYSALAASMTDEPYVPVIEPQPVPPDVPEIITPKPKPLPPEVPIGAAGCGAVVLAWWQGIPFEWLALGAVIVVVAIIILRKWRD